MKITEVKHSSFGGRDFTTLAFEQEPAAGSWRAVVVDGRRVEPVFDSGVSGRRDMVTLPGIVEPSTRSVDLVP